MNISDVLNLWAMGWGFGAAVVVLLLGVVMEMAGNRESRWVRFVRAGLVPVAVGVGIIVAYGLAAGWSGGKGERAWWEGESRQMLVPAAGVAVLLILMMRMVDGWVKWIIWAVLGLVMMLVMVRGPWMGTEMRPAWEGWGGFAVCVLGMFVVYGVAMAGVVGGVRVGANVEKLWLVPAGVMWVASSAAGVSVMLAFDMAAGRMFVYLAVMAGVAIVAGIWKRWREAATWAGVLIAAVYGGAWVSAAFFDRGVEWALPQAAMGMLAAGPVAAAVAWVPLLRKRPWVCVGVAMGVAVLLVAPAVIVAANAAKSMEG